jgi:hypothetical protein
MHMYAELPFKNRQLRDLAWAIGSPPLLAPDDQETRWLDKAWFQRRYAEYLPVLNALQRDPADLLQWLETASQGRLGSYFESLWMYWLKTNQRFRLLQANLPVRVAGRTLGEFDLLVEDTHSHRQLHWELAVKFYLGTADTQQMENWWGPMKRDRLDLKLGHMQTHQCQLSRLPAAKQTLEKYDIVVDEAWSIVKGRLFYPGGDAVHPAPHNTAGSHLSGWWQTTTEFNDACPANAGIRYSRLDKSQWLSPVLPQQLAFLNGLSGTDRHGQIPADRPVMLAACADGVELSRGFVVPDAWPCGPFG